MIAASANRILARTSRARVAFLLCVAMLGVSAFPAAAQKEKKKKNDNASSSNTQPIIPMGEEQQIDYLVSTMLGAWQLGDLDRLHQVYADDAVFISGLWVPPVFGWANYLPLYQQQRARMQQVRLDRTNTYIKVSGTVGWACYQWDFGGTVNGQPMTSRGQTTLIMEKRNNRWVIVHNHTSVAQDALPSVQQPVALPANTPPAAQPDVSKPPSR
jgi:ketosteroid isomerase-like protein